MVRFSCPQCKRSLQAPDERSGQTVSCPGCRTPIRVPAAPAAPPSPASEENPFAGLGSSAPPPSFAPPEPGAAYPTLEGETEWRPDLQGGDEPPEPGAAERPERWPPQVQPLGRIHQIHVGRRWPQVLLFAAAALVGLCSVCCFSPVISLLLFGPMPVKQQPGAPPRPPPTAAEETAGSIMLIVGALVFVAGAAGLIFLGVRFRPRTVLVCEEGLAVVRGRTADVCKWLDVRAVWQGVVKIRIVNRFGSVLRTRTDYRYTLERKNGPRLIFTNASSNQIQRLGNTIQREVTRRLLPLAYEAVVKDRRAISFDPFGVGFDALQYGGRSLPWNEVGALSLRSGVVRIYDRRAREWAVAQVARIANLHIFLNIAENLSGRKWQ